MILKQSACPSSYLGLRRLEKTHQQEDKNMTKRKTRPKPTQDNEITEIVSDSAEDVITTSTAQAEVPKTPEDCDRWC